MSAADLILIDCAALTPVPHAAAEMIAVKDGRISFIGPRSARRDLAAARTRVVECGGGLVVPGFNDAHCHPLAHAATLRHIDCSPPGVASIAQLQAVLRGHSGPNLWIRAAGCDGETLAEGRLPTRHELDQAVCDRPVILVERSGQSCVLNSRAMEACGLEHGLNADGVVSGADGRLARALPPLSAEELEIGLRQASRLYLENGITSLQDTSWSNGHRHWTALRHFKDSGILAPRVTMLAGLDALEEFTSRGLRTGDGDGDLRLGAMKIALDESTATAHPSQDAIDDAALRAHLAGFQLSFHVPDLALLHRALNALTMVRRLSLTECLRPRFEHCPICPPPLLPDIVQSGAILVMQPNLFHAAGPRYLRHLDPDQLGWISPVRSILAAGIEVAFGSDAPLTPCSPLAGVAISVTRRVEGGACLVPAEGLAAETALRCYSGAGARCSFEDHDKGGIAVGMRADLVVLDGNPLTIPSCQIAAIRPRLTILGGAVVWER